MKRKILIGFFFLFALAFQGISQKNAKPGDKVLFTRDTVKLDEVVISAMRTATPLRELPAPISVINKAQLQEFSKTIAPDEALRLVPGLKVENGSSGSRVHLYIRGQGILSESGFRGIQVLIDGIPVNDPGGYCPDLYDVDWSVVKNVEVVRGLAASLYGANATGGIVNITTDNGGNKPVNSTLMGSAGSYGFWKILGQVDGTQDKINYRVSYSHMQGHGYRDHQSYMGDNFSEKINWTPSEKIHITQLLTYTNYFNQNAEGINMYRYETFGPRAANTDAVPYNEFHETKRLTGALLGRFDICNNQDITAKVFARMNNYRETSNNGDDYKPYVNMGASAQYNLHLGKRTVKNLLSLGADYQTQTITEHMFAVPGEYNRDSTRVDSYWSRECFDLDQILINQIIKQRSIGVFLIDKLDITPKLHALLNLRYDNVYSSLQSNIPVPDSVSPSGSKTYDKPTYRIGLAYDIIRPFNVFASFGTGFLTPSNDELYNNPQAYGGFNNLIKPSTSQGIDLGIRGDVGKVFHYDVTFFDTWSNNEFYRYGIASRGNNTAFYGNMGKSTKWGIETFVSYSPVKNLIIDAAYTYSNFTYKSADTAKVQWTHWMPNSPRNMLYGEITYTFLKNFSAGIACQWQTKYCIQVDDSIYNNYTIGQTYYQPGSVRSSWVSGYNLWNVDLHYKWKLGWLRGDLSLYVKNVLDTKYFGFTEPNNGVDYNSYQPAPGREFFVNLRLNL
ncbi:MAG: TonB-dependent receptor [Bacteroidota bacterium]|jgi:iron complex outermembrane recepter protein